MRQKQRLVNEQVAQLTGQRFLAGYSNEEAQYKALMDAGTTFAQQYQLRPGVSLSAQQMAQLTSDIVWLVEQTVTLPDGSTTQALVPQVYARMKAGDLDGTGTLLAGQVINLNLSGDISNTGTVAGRTIVNLTAENVNNLGGRISANDTSVTARTDLNNIGGTIDGVNSLTAIAGRDLNIVSTTSSASNYTEGTTVNNFSHTGIDRIAGLYVTSESGATLIASAGRDVNLVAGIIANNGATGATAVTAQRDLNLGTVGTSSSASVVRGFGTDFLEDRQSADVGSQINTQGNLSLAAGRDINAKAANVQAGGDLTAVAGNNINISNGQQTNSTSFGLTSSDSDLFSSSSHTERRSGEQSNAVGSSIGGKTITSVAGNDQTVTGSSVISDAGTTLSAGNNLTIQAATNTSKSTDFSEKKESGFFDDGLSYNASEQSSDQKNQNTTAAASTVGSIGGNVTLVADNQYRQVGSNVVAPAGDVAISARSAEIVEARETNQSSLENKFSQSGLGITLSNPVISALQGAGQTMQMANSVTKTDDTRVQALGAAVTALSAYNTYNQVANVVSHPEQAASVGINISIGSSESQSNTERQSNTAAGSKVVARGDVTIIATGAGQASNLTVQGSQVVAGGNTTLIADNQVNLLAAQNTSSERNTSSGSSASLGIGINFGAQTGISFNASASSNKGQGSGDDLTYTNTQVQAGNKLNIVSGGDTNLVGAVAAASQVTAQVGGNLNIRSPQDISTYTETQSSSGGGVSLCIPPFCYGASSVSASFGKGSIDSNYQSVGEQSAIRAGDAGFSVTVGGNTALVGGQITSTDKAVQEGKNSFQTGGTLTTTDIQNQARYNGSGYRFGADFSGALGDQSSAAALADMRDRGMTDAQIERASNTVTSPGGSAGYGNTSGDAGSVTTAGISGIAGNTGARTGDAETSLKPIFDKDKVKADIDAQIAITAEFGKQATRAGAQFAQDQLNKANALTALADLETDPARKADLKKQAEAIESDWKEGGPLRVLMHAGIGLLGGGMDGALGAAASATMTPTISQMLADANLPDSVRSGLLMASGAAIGATFGGDAGATTGFNEVTNNGLGSVTKRLGIPAIIACMRNEACRRMTGMVGAAIALQAAKIMKDNPGISESIAYTIAATDLSNYGLGGKPSVPVLPIAQNGLPNNTGNTSSPPNYGGSTTTPGTALETNNNTGGNQTSNPAGNGTTVGGGYGAGGQPVIDPIVLSVDPRLPIPKPTVGSNGIPVESNGKHTPGLPGYSPNEGTEPRESIELFGTSVASPARPNDVRYAVDTQGEIHRFSNNGLGVWHWSGSTADENAPLNGSVIPNGIRQLPGVNRDIKIGKR